MPRSVPIQTSFTSGELSPRLEGRTDLDQYKSGCKTLLNAKILPHGPVTRRGGTQYVDSSKNGTETIRLVTFEFSTSQAYVLEFGPFYIRVYANQAQVNAGPFSDEFSVDFDVYDPLEIVTPYSEVELFELQFTQSADVLYIAHGSHSPRMLSRSGPVVWSLDVFQSTFGPYLDLNTTATTITPSGTTGSITLTASAAIFSPSHVGALWRIDPAGTGPTGYVQITGYTSDTVVTATVIQTLSGTTGTTDWSEGAWSDFRGWPAAVAFYEQRLVWAGTNYEPQTIWGSQNGDYYNHQGGSADSDAIRYTIASEQVNTIQWISSGELLAIGTAGGIHVASASTRDEALTPTNVRIVRRTRFGCAQIAPIRIADVAVFIQRGGEKIRQLEYIFESDSYSAPDLTLLSEHITRGGITQLAYQQDPDSIIWGVRGDGTLVGMTYEKDQKVFGWHPHVIGGASDAGGTQAQVESVAVIPGSSDATQDEIWVSVKRYVNGAVVRHIEIITPGHKPDGDIEDAFFVDAGLTYSGAATTVLTGLDHLEGETVSILADGATHPDKIVASGSITLDRSATKVHVGKGFVTDIETMPIDAGQAEGTAQGRTKRISTVTLRLYQSVGAEIGSEPGNLDRIPFRSSADLMDTALPLFTGDIRAAFPKGYGTNISMYIRQSQPLPLTILALIPEVRTNG